MRPAGGLAHPFGGLHGPATHRRPGRGDAGDRAAAQPAACVRLPRHAPPLRKWATGIAVRRGKKIAIVALARRMAGVLLAMMRDRTCYLQPALQSESSGISESATRLRIAPAHAIGLGGTSSFRPAVLVHQRSTPRRVGSKHSRRMSRRPGSTGCTPSS
jgi:hypothetical protein